MRIGECDKFSTFWVVPKIELNLQLVQIWDRTKATRYKIEYCVGRILRDIYIELDGDIPFGEAIATPRSSKGIRLSRHSTVERSSSGSRFIVAVVVF